MTKNHPEIEGTCAVGPEERLPELGTLPEVASVSGPTQQDLEATYFDTAALNPDHRGDHGSPTCRW